MKLAKEPAVFSVNTIKQINGCPMRDHISVVWFNTYICKIDLKALNSIFLYTICR